MYKAIAGLLCLLLTACTVGIVEREALTPGADVSSPPGPTLTSTPTAMPDVPLATPTTGIGAVGITALPITVTPVKVEQTYRLSVSRDGATFWLKSSNVSASYGCESGVPDWNYDTFGCYFPLEIWVIDLDGDGDPEVASWWEQGGSGGYRSFHVHRWDGDTYQLIGEFVEMQLSVALQDLDDDNQQEVVLRYNAEPHQLPIPWVDVYALSGGQLVSVNEEYPGFYEALLTQYEEMLPDYQAVADGWPEALAELEQRIEMAKNITGDD
jgi:hypothetical protein